MGEGGVAAGGRATDPAGIGEADAVADIALDAQRVRGVGKPQHLQRGKDDRVVTAAGHVDDFDPGQARVGNLRQVEREAGPGDRQCIDAAAAIEVAKRKVGNAQHVVAGTAAHHVGAAAAGQRVVANTADHDVGGGRSSEAVGIGAPCVRHRTAEVAPEDHVALAGK